MISTPFRRWRQRKRWRDMCQADVMPAAAPCRAVGALQSGSGADAYEVSRRLAPFARQVKVKRCHWISIPLGDLGTEWCTDCGRAKVRNLRRRDRKNRSDYILDGGWRTDHDSQPFCACCGAVLDGALTEYAALEELEFYREHGFRPCEPSDAYILDEMLLGLPSSAMAEGIAIASRFCDESDALLASAPPRPGEEAGLPADTASPQAQPQHDTKGTE